MSRDQWKLPFDEIRRKVEPLEAASFRLYHANVMTPFHERAETVEFIKLLEPALMSYQLVGIIETPTPACRHHAHYFFGEKKALSHLTGILSDLHTAVSRIPAGLLPEFSLPAIENQGSENVVLWANIVFAMAWELERWYLSADVEYKQNLELFDFRLWEDLKQPAGIDPRPVLTHQTSGLDDIKRWTDDLQNDRFQIPEYIGAYVRGVESEICGDFLQATLGAIDLLTGIDYELPVDQANSRRTRPNIVTPIAERRSRGKNVDKDSLFSLRATELLHGLLPLHGCNRGVPIHTALTQQVLQDRLREQNIKMSKSTISRSMAELMKNVDEVLKEGVPLDGMDKYAELCETEAICDELSGLQVRSNQYLEKRLARGQERQVKNIESYDRRGY